MALIDLKDKNKPYQPVDIRFNSQGDAFLVSDTRGQVTMFQLQANKYIVVCQSAKLHNVSHACFIGKQQSSADQVFVVLKEKKMIETHSLNGKLIDKISGAHSMEVRGLEHNMAPMGAMITVSPDSCVIWTSSHAQSNSVSKLRSIYSKDGNHFIQGKFTADGQSIVTLFKDGDLFQWSLDAKNQLDSANVQLPAALKSPQLTSFDVGYLTIVVGGNTLPYLIFKSLQSGSEPYLYRLPAGSRGVDHLQMLRDQNLLAFISEGFFYLLDISYSHTKEKNKVIVKLNIRIPHEQVKTFDIDSNMTTMVLGTNAGNVYIYDLPKALENERIINHKKVQMGVEEELVYTYLERAHIKEVTSFLSGGDYLQSTIIPQIPLGTVVTANGGGSNNLMDSLHQSNDINNYFPSFIQKDQQLNTEQPPLISDRSLNHYNYPTASMQRTSVIQQPAIIYHPMQSTTSVNGQQVADRQEFLNAGLSTSHAAVGKRSVMNTNQVSIMKTIQSSVMRGNPNVTQSVMQSQYQPHHHHHQGGINSSVISQSNADMYAIDENFQAEYKLSGSSTLKAEFNMQKVKSMLKQFGEYPDKYRFLTWKHLLGLGLNKEAFQGLLRKGVHPAFKNLHRRYPITQNRQYNKLVRTLSALGNWCPVFAADNVEFLPQMLFPFIKVIPNDDLLVFELIVALIVQYQQTWYEGYPAEPLVVMSAIEQIIELEDPKLLAHLRANSFTPQVYAWPLLKTLFTDLLTRDDWLRLMDHIFTYNEDPELLLFYCASILLTSRQTLLQQVHSIEELVTFQGTQTGYSFKKISQLAFKLHGLHKQTIFTGTLTNQLPLKQTDGGYPMFTRYPDQVALSQVRLREKIIQEEDEISKKAQLLEELRLKTQQVLANEERIRRQQEAAASAEIERKRKMQVEQEHMLQERIRLEEITRLAKLEHIRKIEDCIEQALYRQEDMKKEEARVTEEEFIQRSRQAKYDFESRLQDENIANMEFKANQKLLELLQKQQSDDALRKLKTDLETRQREEAHRDRVLSEKWRAQDDEQRLKSELIRQTMTQQAKQMHEVAERARFEQKLREQELEKELQMIQIEEQRRLRQLEEDQIVRKQRFVEEMRNKTEQEFQYEQERLWQQLHDEKERERGRGEARLRSLEDERYRIEQQLALERQEREDYERQQRFEHDVLAQRRAVEEEQAHRQYQMQKQAEFEREQRNIREAEVQRQREIENKVMESDNLMNMLRQTEVQILDICDRGQKELIDRKTNRMSSGGITPTNYGSHNNTVVNKTQGSIMPPGSNNTTGIDYNNYNPYSAQNSMELRMGAPYYQNHFEKENHSLNQPRIVNNHQPMKLPSHQQTLYSHTIEEDEKQREEFNNHQHQQHHNQYQGDQSSLSDASSLGDTSQQRFDSMLIEKHNQVKKEFEDYKQSFGHNQTTNQTSNVFAYPTTTVGYTGQTLNQKTSLNNPQAFLNAQTISSNPYADKQHYPIMSTISASGPQHPNNQHTVNSFKRHMNETDSYLSSSSSSGDEEGVDHNNRHDQPHDDDSSLSSSGLMNDTSHHQKQMLNMQGGGQFNNNQPQSSFSSSTSSMVSSAKKHHEMPLKYQKRVY